MSRIYEKQKIERDVTVGVECDNCEKQVKGEVPSTWHYFCVNWGYHGSGDPQDSTEWLDACSPACYVALIKRRSSRIKSDRAEIDEMTLDFARLLVKYVEAIE